jgi:hypothetical protein
MPISAFIKFSVLWVVLFVVTFSHPSFGQSKDRIIPFPEWSSTSDDEDVVLELVGIKVGNKQITLGKTFPSDQDWLKEMKLVVKNVSKKPIVSFGIGGGLLETVDKELEPYQSFPYGIGWGWKAGAHSKKSFRPGETIELDYSNVDDLTKRMLAKAGEGSFCKLHFMAPSVKFNIGDAGLLPNMRFNTLKP